MDLREKISFCEKTTGSFFLSQNTDTLFSTEIYLITNLLNQIIFAHPKNKSRLLSQVQVKPKLCPPQSGGTILTCVLTRVLSVSG